jgi:hypothetical protein
MNIYLFKLPSLMHLVQIWFAIIMTLFRRYCPAQYVFVQIPDELVDKVFINVGLDQYSTYTYCTVYNVSLNIIFQCWQTQTHSCLLPIGSEEALSSLSPVMSMNGGRGRSSGSNTGYAHINIP